ncbi:M23 family metallopeptidase [Leifsonia bigeumensis]|uniref:M23 family metallopeptidase n=1 Tax=Leifsonella bigeumensis TaxID=433643 RepID=A0ABP7EZR8_9MICO
MTQSQGGPARVRARGAGNSAGSRTLWWRNRLFVTLALLSMVFTGTVAAPSHDAAWAVDYPSWNDVLKARNDVKAKKVEIARLQALLKQLQDKVDATEAEAKRLGEVFQKAVEAFDAQDRKTQEYQRQADEAQEKAEEYKKRAGQMMARLARIGGDDLTATLFFNGDDASDVLSQVGMASKINEQSRGLHDKAVQQQNTAQSLTDQANVARKALDELRIAAEAAQLKAQKAAEAAAAAYSEQQANNSRLQAQLATLQSNRVHTEAEYVKGVKERWGAGGAVEISSQGWARPSAGHVTSPYGARVPPVSGVNPFHRGTDLGAACNSPIYAAHTGEVVYTGWYGTYGYFILLQHESNIRTGYAHIVSGGILVHVGQTVGVGQQIARVGATGAATGCHLHFEVRINNSAVDPQPFMRARGINLT